MARGNHPNGSGHYELLAAGAGRHQSARSRGKPPSAPMWGPRRSPTARGDHPWAESTMSSSPAGAARRPSVATHS
eukprot:12880687-Alexandrium_andersonii.AAC.1